MKDKRVGRKPKAATATTWRSGTQEVVSAEEVMAVEVPQPEIEQMMAKLEPDGDSIMDDDSSNPGASEGKKRPWDKTGVKKKKKVPGAKNFRIRKYVQPKNAVMCLNELQPGLSYVTEVGKGVSMPISVSVEVGGQKYKGFGSSKTLAKQAAAEAALISFVKPPTPNTDTAEDDQTPWATLASFAIYKLFNEWRDGRVGMTTSQPMATQAPVITPHTTTNQGFPRVALPPPVAPVVVPQLPPPPMPEIPAEKQEGFPKPAKNLPDNAANIHPAVVLHQMKPNIQYNIDITSGEEENSKIFVASTIIDGQQFTGQGVKVKKAKFTLAKEAIRVLFGVQSTFEMAP